MYSNIKLFNSLIVKSSNLFILNRLCIIEEIPSNIFEEILKHQSLCSLFVIFFSSSDIIFDSV